VKMAKEVVRSMLGEVGRLYFSAFCFFFCGFSIALSSMSMATSKLSYGKKSASPSAWMLPISAVHRQSTTEYREPLLLRMGFLVASGYNRRIKIWVWEFNSRENLPQHTSGDKDLSPGRLF